MTPLRQRMIEDMVSAGLMASTQAAYIQAVRVLPPTIGARPMS